MVHTAPNVKHGRTVGGAPVGLRADLHRHDDIERMERFTRPLMERYGVRIIIGKGGLGAQSARRHSATSAASISRSIGGAAALETTWIEAIEDVDLDDLNPESLWKFRISGFGPLLVAMDSHGGSALSRHQCGGAIAAAMRCLRALGALK